MDTSALHCVIVCYRSFSRDIMAAMLVDQNSRLSLPWELNSIFKQILCKHFVLFGPPIWPPCHVSENHLLMAVFYYSATWPKGVQRMADQYMKDPVRVFVGSLDLNVSTVYQTWPLSFREGGGGQFASEL